MTSEHLSTRGKNLQRDIAKISREGNISGKHTLDDIRSLALRQNELRAELRSIQRKLRTYGVK